MMPRKTSIRESNIQAILCHACPKLREDKHNKCTRISGGHLSDLGSTSNDVKSDLQMLLLGSQFLDLA
jgi:hypothetical protein